MKHNILNTCLIVISIFFNTNSIACDQGIENLDIVKQKLIKYHDSGLYEKNISAVIDHAKQYLQTRLAHKKSTDQFAMVLDIDETSLSNYSDMLALSFGGTLEDIVRAEGKGTDPAILPTLALYQFAKTNHVAVFFVTGRTEQYRTATANNLENAGYQHWDGLYLKAENYHEKSAAPYKIATRQQITQQGYDIVLNIGDQNSDLVGGYADKTFKLPNPYYLIP